MLEVTPIPALRDNYIWALQHGENAVVVDPGDAQPVFAWLRARDCKLTAILITHHHADHTAGIDGLIQHAPVPVLGPADETRPIPHLSIGLNDGDCVPVPGLDTTLTALRVPGHTLGATALLIDDYLFSGDTLFSAGCGRLFEGTAAVMHDSLNRLASLPSSTRVCCGHEYTVGNLAFAATVEPDNADIARRHTWALAQRSANAPTLPSTLAEELIFNPFLRCEQPTVRASAEAWDQRPLHQPVDVFAALRRWKDEFRAPAPV